MCLQENRLESPGQTRKAREANIDSGKDGVAYSCLLKNELLRASIDDLKVFILLLYYSCIAKELKHERRPVSSIM